MGERFERLFSSKESREKREVWRRLVNIQLDYATRLYQKQKDAGEPASFTGIISSSTALISSLTETYHLRSGAAHGEQALYQSRLMNVFHEAFTHRDEEGVWKKNLTKFLEKEMTDQEEANGAIGRERKEAGSFRVQPKRARLGADRRGRKNVTERFGLGEYDDYVELHIPRDRQTEQKGVRTSFETLAVQIVDQYPWVRAVTARSWILGRKGLADQLGFSKVDEETALKEKGTWWQLLKQDGQIDEKRLKHLEETDELPYHVVTGVIPVEEFLKQYLPEDRRGKVTLKRRDARGVERFLAIEQLRQKVRSHFLEWTWEQLERVLRNEEVMKDFLKTKGGQELLDQLREAHKQQTSFKDLGGRPSSGEDVGKAFEQFVQEETYTSETVEIPPKREVLTK